MNLLIELPMLLLGLFIADIRNLLNKNPTNKSILLVPVGV